MRATVVILLCAAAVTENAIGEDQIDFGKALALDQHSQPISEPATLDPMPQEPKPLFPVAPMRSELFRMAQHQAPVLSGPPMPIDLSIACELEEQGVCEAEPEDASALCQPAQPACP